MRLDKLLCLDGHYTRSQAKEVIRQGGVTVDGQVITRPETAVDPEATRVEVYGRRLNYQLKHYLMLNKPAGVLSATEDRRDKTALDLLPENYRRLKLFPAGRLDKDAEGFLLLTNDGELAHALMSPKRHVDKLYFVRVTGKLTEQDRGAFARGVIIDGGYQCKSAGLEILVSGEESTALVTLREGRFHQVKRMFAAQNKCVIYLKRIAIASVTLDEALEPAGFRELTLEEVARLRDAANL